MVKSNMTPEEQAEALAKFPCGHTIEELERSKHYFKRIIFYDTDGKKNYRRYFCPECGWFEVKRPWGGYDIYQDDPFRLHHNDQAECPNCGMEGRLVCLGKAGKMKNLCQWGRIAFIRSADGVLNISAGEARRIFDRDDLDPWPEYFERVRYVIKPGKRQKWKLNTWWLGSSGGHRWEPIKTFSEPFPATSGWCNCDPSGDVGFVGMEKIKETSMRYCQAEAFFRDTYGREIDDRFEGVPVRGVIQYMGEYSAKPQLEMLVKLGHGAVVKRLLEYGSVDRKLVNWRAKDPAGFFRLSKREYAVLRTVGESAMDALECIRNNHLEGMDLTEILRIWNGMGKYADAFFSICGSYQADPRKAAAWLQGQAMGIGTAVTQWKDYLSMATRLERNMTFRRNLYPDDLRAEHDGAVKLVAELNEKMKALDSAAREKEYRKKRYRQLRKLYEYSDGELSIMVPRTEAEITREGEALKHCVGGYARRHTEGKTTILFLRKIEDQETPYVTIEINDGTLDLVQVHGYRNEGDGARPPILRHEAFFNEWREWMRQGSPRTPNGKPIRPVKKKKEVKTA